MVEHGQVARVPQRVDQQLARRALVATGERDAPQALSELPFGERVGPAKGRMEKRDRRLLVQCGWSEGASQQQENRNDSGLGRECDVFGSRGGGHAGLGQGPAQGGVVVL